MYENWRGSRHEGVFTKKNVWTRYTTKNVSSEATQTYSLPIPILNTTDNVSRYYMQSDSSIYYYYSNGRRKQHHRKQSNLTVTICSGQICSTLILSAHKKGLVVVGIFCRSGRFHALLKKVWLFCFFFLLVPKEYLKSLHRLSRCFCVHAITRKN